MPWFLAALQAGDVRSPFDHVVERTTRYRDFRYLCHPRAGQAGSLHTPFQTLRRRPVGIAVPKDKPEFRDAVMAALIGVQKAGITKELLKKWELDPNNFKEPDILSVK